MIKAQFKHRKQFQILSAELARKLSPSSVYSPPYPLLSAFILFMWEEVWLLSSLSPL